MKWKEEDQIVYVESPAKMAPQDMVEKAVFQVAPKQSHKGVCRKKHLTRSSREKEIAKSVKWVIFPDNKCIKIWDMLILILLVLLVFILPFQIGISASYLLSFDKSPTWVIFNVFINACFAVDTFLYFWRAYRHNNNGRIVFNLNKIRRRYLKSYFLPHLISCAPTVLIVTASGDLFSDSNNRAFVLILILDFFKFVRFVRVRTILGASDIMKDLYDKFRASHLEFARLVLFTMIVAHWFACIFSFVAFCESDLSFEESKMLGSVNWIHSWYENNYVEGGINPIGRENFLDRYILSLFWSIQTITSIGYGNVAPITRQEWWVASLLQLFAGFAWAYLIGGIVAVVAASQVNDALFRQRIDQAKDLVEELDTAVENYHEDMEEMRVLSNQPPENSKLEEQLSDEITIDSSKLEDELVGINEYNVGARIKKYVHCQKARSSASTCVTTVEERFPILETLTPELSRAACYLLLRESIEKVRYLSSTYLNMEEQGALAQKCLFMEFAAGDVYRSGDGIGKDGQRGIVILQSGCAIACRRSSPHTSAKYYVFAGGNGSPPMVQDFSLVEDSFYIDEKKQRSSRACGRRLDLSTKVRGSKEGLKHMMKMDKQDATMTTGLHMCFLSFSKVILIPREAIMEVLDNNKRAWKDCARWRYLLALLRLKSHLNSKTDNNIFFDVSKLEIVLHNNEHEP